KSLPALIGVYWPLQFCANSWYTTCRRATRTPTAGGDCLVAEPAATAAGADLARKERQRPAIPGKHSSGRRTPWRVGASPVSCRRGKDLRCAKRRATWRIGAGLL